jgi:excisionase family DNA binding protein
MRDEQLLSPEQVAERLQVSEYTAVKWLREGRIKARKLGKFWRVKAEDLEAFINEPPPLTLVAPPPEGPAETPQARKASLVARIRTLHGQGLSAQAIANRLNIEGVPTISGRGQWQRGTVANLLAQAEGTSC